MIIAYHALLTGQQSVEMNAAAAHTPIRGANKLRYVRDQQQQRREHPGQCRVSNGQAINGALQAGVSAYALSAGLKSSYGGGSGGTNFNGMY